MNETDDGGVGRYALGGDDEVDGAILSHLLPSHATPQRVIHINKQQPTRYVYNKIRYTTS